MPSADVKLAWPNATVDADGVALAAIKGLEREVDRLRERVRELER